MSERNFRNKMGILRFLRKWSEGVFRGDPYFFMGGTKVRRDLRYRKKEETSGFMEALLSQSIGFALVFAFILFVLVVKTDTNEKIKLGVSNLFEKVMNKEVKLPFTQDNFISDVDFAVLNASDSDVVFVEEPATQALDPERIDEDILSMLNSKKNY